MLRDRFLFIYLFSWFLLVSFSLQLWRRRVVSAATREDVPHGWDRAGRGPWPLPTPSGGGLIPNHLLQPPVHGHAHALPQGRRALGPRHLPAAPPGRTPPDTVRTEPNLLRIIMHMIMAHCSPLPPPFLPCFENQWKVTKNIINSGCSQISQ